MIYVWYFCCDLSLSYPQTVLREDDNGKSRIIVLNYTGRIIEAVVEELHRSVDE